MTLNTQVSLLAAFAGLALTIACSSESAGPGPLPSCGAHGTQLSLAVAQYTSINPASDSGCVTFAANASPDTAEYLVLPWSTGGTPATSTSFILQSATPVAATIAPEFVSGRISPSGSTTGPRGPNAVAFDHFLRESARARRYALPTRSITAASVPAPPAPSPAGPPTVGSSRTFKVCSNAKCSTFANVGAVARAVGTHIAIYVDTLAPSPIDSATLRGLQQVFDSRLYPLDTATFGNVSDIDGNSVVIVLMTGTVNHLVSKAQCSGGYVAGFFFTGDLDPAFASQFNNGEIFYSVVPDPNGTLSCAHTNADVVSLTPVIFTHEFQHMINFVQHVLVRSANSEEGWLDEGLSKYAEELAGRSYLPDSQQAFSRYAFNSVSDAYDYLVAPGSSPLLIPVDSGSLAEVGASWLFTRYIVDQFGATLAGQLAQSSLSGAANVTAKTGQPFATTVSNWAFANWVSDLPGFTAPAELRYTTWHFRTTYASLHAQDSIDFARAYPLLPLVRAGSAVNVSGTLWSGSGAYMRVVQKPGDPAFTLQFSGPAGASVSAAVLPRLNVLRIR